MQHPRKQSTLTSLFGCTPPSIRLSPQPHQKQKPTRLTSQQQIRVSLQKRGQSAVEPAIERDGLPTVFRLKWDAARDTFEAEWCAEPADEDCFVCDANWRIADAQYQMRVRMYTADNWPVAPDDDTAPFQLGTEPVYRNIPYLKSHLQKCVRKGRADLAVPTAKHLMRLSMSHFVRRLFIIVIEDVDVFPNLLAVLAWLTASAAAFLAHPPLEIVEYLLGAVHSVCVHSTRWPWEASPHQLPHRSWALRLTPDATNVERSLAFRHCYGGMHGDLTLIENAIDFRTDDCRPLPIRRIIWTSVPHLPQKLWDVAAIDFHVAPNVLPYLQRSLTKMYTGTQLKQLMWTHGSRTNYRDSEADDARGKTDASRADWKSAQYGLASLQRFLIQNNC
jgi:hypothetical protein